EGVVALGPFALEQCFGSAVGLLLAPVGANGIAAVVPHHRTRVKAQGPTAILQPPTHVDVVAGDAEYRVKAAHGLERGSAKRHIAARNMLGHEVREQYLRRSAGRVRDAVRDRTVAGWGDIRSADPDMVRGLE